jgi:predicted small lipoprotein YifL
VRPFRAYLLIVLLFALAACGKIGDIPDTKTPMLSTATAEDWKKALDSSFTSSQMKDEGNGVVSFLACFQKDADKCFASSFASHDAFKKRTFFMGGPKSVGPPDTYVKTYLSVGDSQRPYFLMLPHFFSGTHQWLFMRNLSILLDGKILFEKNFNLLEVSQRIETYGVYEGFQFALSDDEIKSLKNIKAESTLSIRLTGKDSYEAIDEKGVKLFKSDIANMLFIYENINKSLNGNVPLEMVIPKT